MLQVRVFEAFAGIGAQTEAMNNLMLNNELLKKYGINVKIVQINDYVESINQYTAGQFDGCTMANTDALGIPAAGGVDSTALIIGDFSNGNDAVISKTAKSINELKGTNVNLVDLIRLRRFLVGME